MPLRRLAGTVRGGETEDMTAFCVMQMPGIGVLLDQKDGEVSRVGKRGSASALGMYLSDSIAEVHVTSKA